MKILLLLAFVFSISNFAVANETASANSTLEAGDVVSFDGENISFGDSEKVDDQMKCPANTKPVVVCKKEAGVRKPRKCAGMRTCHGHKHIFCVPKERRCPIS